jgi:hypothetical protein
MHKSGSYYHKIFITKSSDEVDEFNKLVSTKIPVFQARSNVQILSGSELLKSGMELSSEFLSILMRRDRRLLHEHFITWEGNEYSIDMIRPSDDNARLEIIVTASREF